MKKPPTLPYYQPWIGEEEKNQVIDTLDSGWLTTGPKTKKFEQEICTYVGAQQAVALNSCTGALHLSLVALGIGIGDEVITSPFTFAATGNVIHHAGAKPVLVDIRRDTYNIDPQRIEEAITPRTKAIIPVHYAGQPCDMTEILEIAKSHNLFVIEDGAHAIGAEYEGRQIGTFGDMTCFSFYATKNITTGEGGAITLNDELLANRLRSLSLHGISKDAWKRYSSDTSWHYEIEDFGWKYNMTDIQAALGIPQLQRLDQFVTTRRKYAQIYNQELSQFPGSVVVPYESPNVKHTYHLYPLLVEKDRNGFIEKMHQQGIECSVHFIPLHIHPIYGREFGLKWGDFPNAEWVYEREVSLPLYPMMSEEDVWRVVHSVGKILMP